MNVDVRPSYSFVQLANVVLGRPVDVVDPLNELGQSYRIINCWVAKDHIAEMCWLSAVTRKEWRRAQRAVVAGVVRPTGPFRRLIPMSGVSLDDHLDELLDVAHACLSV